MKWYLEYKFNHIDILSYVDTFEFNDEWPYIQIVRGNQTVCLGYMDKSPQITGNACDVSIFHKYTVYRIYKASCSGNVIVSGEASLPGLQLDITRKMPYTVKCQFDFDFHTMMVILATMDDVLIFEGTHVALTKASIMYQGMKIEVAQTVLSYTGVERHDFFRDFCHRLYGKYNRESEPIIKMFDILPDPQVDTAKTHLALAYDIWYRGARENQREWPSISTSPANDRSVEFPKDSGIWYTPPEGKYVGLSLRHDDNIYKYIPKIYMRDHRLRSSYLKDYLNNTSTFSSFSIPTLVSKSIRNYGNVCSKPRLYQGDSEVLHLNSDGSIMMRYNNPKHIVYNGMVVGVVGKKFDNVYGEVQLLDRGWNRSKVLANGIWHESSGHRILDIPALPWYYKQIVHDYNKLGRLTNGPYMDLMHIGIVDAEGKDMITFPVDDISRLYVSPCLQTHHLLTFKFKPYVYEKLLVSKTNHVEKQHQHSGNQHYQEQHP